MNAINLKNCACVLGLLAALCACSVDVPTVTPTSYETMVVEKSNIVIPYKYSATLKGKSDVKITPMAEGQLMRICVSEGQHVKVGTVLFVIDQRNAKLDLEDAKANLEAALAQEQSAKLEYESNKNLFEKKIVSSYMLNNSLNAYKQAQAAVAQSRSAVNRAKVNLGFCTITSPVEGVMGQIPVTVGEMVSPMTELAVVSGNVKMEAEFSITEDILQEVTHSANGKNLNELMKGLPDVKFVMKNGTEYEHTGRVTTATGTVDAATGTVKCTAVFPNSEGKLYSGIQGSVVIPLSEENVMVIPQAAVVRLQDRSLVYLVGKDSCATSVTVTTTSAGSKKDVVVLTGLKPGDKIVTVGANNVKEGDKVLFAEDKSKEKK